MDKTDRTNRTDKFYDMADNLGRDLIMELTGGLDMQKAIGLNDAPAKNKTRRLVFKKLPFAASVAIFAAMFGLLTGLAIAANILVPRFFPGLGTVDVEPQAVRELGEPVYLENPEKYNVAIDYAAFIRNADGSGTLLLEYIYVYGIMPRPDLDRIFAGDIEPGEEFSDELMSEAADYGDERNRYQNFSYTVEPCGAGEANQNLAVPEIYGRNQDLKNKYNFEKMEIRALGEIIENIEESEYYRLTFDNGQTAVIRLAPIGGEPAQSLWTDENGGFMMRVTPYSSEDLRYGVEVFPTENWSDTAIFSIQWLDTELALGRSHERDDSGGEDFMLHAFANGTKTPRFGWSPESYLPTIPEHSYRDLKGRRLNGFNDFTFSYKGHFAEFLHDQANMGSWYRMLEEEGELENYLQNMKEAGIEQRIYTKEDFYAKSISAFSMLINAVFDESKAKRHKVKLPSGDGEIEPGQEISVHGIKYWIESVRREGDKVEIIYMAESDRNMAKQAEPASSGAKERNMRESIGGIFKVDGYEAKAEFRNPKTNLRQYALIIEGVGKKTKSLDIYLHYAHFFQFGRWSVDISHLAD